MPSVQVTIAGHAYRMACGEGDEPRLEALASSFDGRIADLRRTFGEIGDLRLHVMAALQIADELGDATGRAEAREAEASALRADMQALLHRKEADERAVADALARTADRIERMAAGLAGATAGERP